MDFEEASILADIENQKEILKIKTEKFADFIYANSEKKDKGKKEIMKIMMTDIISTELSMQYGINKIIEG
jgi:hypothetical protein